MLPICLFLFERLRVHDFEKTTFSSYRKKVACVPYTLRIMCQRCHQNSLVWMMNEEQVGKFASCLTWQIGFLGHGSSWSYEEKVTVSGYVGSDAVGVVGCALTVKRDIIYNHPAKVKFLGK